MAVISQLRPITQRLNSLPVKDLPRIAYFLASSITSCSHILSNPQTQVTSGGQDDSVLVHKLKTKISSLLQDRTPQGRWTAIVLVKAVIEAGSWEALKDCEPWARSLLSILGKSDPLSTKKLAVITLTRIFLLTQPYPTLIREITTPLLPSFISSCLNLVSRKDTATLKVHVKANMLLPVVLESFNLLLPHHPTTFRPFSGRIHELLLTFITDPIVSAEAKCQARELFASLHYCTAKNAATSEWENACKSLIASVHASADQLFRAVIEDWESSDEHSRQTSIKHNYEEVVAKLNHDPLSLPSWEGIHDGAMHIVDLISLLSTFLSKSTMSAVSIPIGLILDLTARLCAIILPTQGKNTIGIRHNPEVDREEREELFLYIPLIHLTTFNLFSNLIDAVQATALPVYLAVLDQAASVFGAESDLPEIRHATFRLIGQLLPHIGPSVTKTEIRTLSPMLKSCAKELVPLEQSRTLKNGTNINPKSGSSTLSNADSFLKATKKSNGKAQSSAPPSAAWQLLPTIFQYLPSNLLNQSLRGELDRATILAGHKEALLASTLNPPPLVRGKAAPASLLPWLSHISRDDLTYEAFLRPRMPIVSREINKASDDSADEAMDVDTAYASTMPWNRQPEQDTAGGEASLLNRVESALPAVTSPYSNGNGITPELTAIDPSSRNTASPQKRDFTQLEPSNLSSSTAQSAGASFSHDPKRVKISAASNPDSQVTTVSALADPPELLETDQWSSAISPAPIALQGAKAITDNVAPLTSVAIPPSGASTATIPPTAPVATETKVVDEDEEESDFEIPEINVDPDTDDELEDGDDEEDQAMGGQLKAPYHANSLSFQTQTTREI